VDNRHYRRVEDYTFSYCDLVCIFQINSRVSDFPLLPTKYCIIVNKSLCSARKSTLTHDRIKQNLPFPQGTPLQYLVTNNTRQKLEDVIRRMAMLAWG
jgi:hypothetical protein